MVKDPLARRYFRFTETQAAILELLAHPTDAETVAAVASRTLGNVTPATISAFFDSLETKNLLDTPEVRERLGTSGSPNKLKQSSILYKQVAAFNPERIFDWLLPRTRWAFTPAFHILGCFLILCGVTTFFLHWKELRAATPDLLNVWTVLLVWPIVFSVSAYHEFSHGLTCRHFGGQVTEVGFMLIYFSPAFYCDVSDAWMFPKRRQRMFVTLAGSYSQLILWGLCTIVWRVTEPDTYINHIMVVVVLFSGLQTLFNLNPLIKLDGYYMLSDYLEIPNLRSKAFSTLWNWITRSPKRKTFREDRSQVIYGACAFIFSATLLVTVYTAIYTWATDKWATAGLVGFAVFSTITLRRTAAESMSGLKTFVSYIAKKRIRNAAILVIVLLLSTFVRWELKISANFKILAASDYIVRAETAGVVTKIFVREGKSVLKGEVLAETRDYEKESELKRITGEILRRGATLKRLRATATPEQISTLLSRIDAKKVELDNVRRIRQERSRLEEILSQHKTRLKFLLDDETSKRQGFTEGVIPEIQWKEARNAVEVQQHTILEAEASILSLDENADRETDLLTKELAVLQSDLEFLRAPNRPEGRYDSLIESISETNAEIKKLESLQAFLMQEIERSRILAPINGIVATPFPERRLNEKLAAGAEFVRLVETAAVTAEMFVPEKELEDIKEGNVVWFKVRSLPDKDFEGRVEVIAPVVQTINGQQMIMVRTRLLNEDGVLKPDMTGVARIYCGQRRIIDIMTRRMVRWIKIDFMHLLP